MFGVACETSRFSSLLAAGDVSRGGTFVAKRRKFHIDDVNQCLLDKFTFLLIDFSKVLCWHGKELQQNSNASSREDYIPQILTVLLEIHCLSFVNNSWNNVTTPSTNERFWPYSGETLRHQYGTSFAESQTFLRAKRPKRRKARRNGCFRRLCLVRAWLECLLGCICKNPCWDKAVAKHRKLLFPSVHI